MTSTVIPAVRYRDAIAMIEWLCAVFGFEKKAVYEESGVVMHAELTLGGGMIMIGSVMSGTPSARFFCQPDETGGKETQSSCLIVEDCGPLYERAKAAGAKILIDLEKREYGGEAFTCADPEGHIWHVGTYNPWA